MRNTRLRTANHLPLDNLFHTSHAPLKPQRLAQAETRICRETLDKTQSETRARPASCVSGPNGQPVSWQKRKKNAAAFGEQLRGCADSTQARLQVMRERQQCSPFPHHARLLAPLNAASQECHPAEPKLRAVRLSEGAGASDDIGCIKVLARAPLPSSYQKVRCQIATKSVNLPKNKTRGMMQHPHTLSVVVTICFSFGKRLNSQCKFWWPLLRTCT